MHAGEHGNAVELAPQILIGHLLQFATVHGKVAVARNTECSSDGVTCLPATYFAWQGATLSVAKSTFATGTTNGTIGFASNNSTDPRIGDIDGDGKSDLIRLIGGTNNVKARIALSSENWVTREVFLMAFNINDAMQNWDIGDFE